MPALSSEDRIELIKPLPEIIKSHDIVELLSKHHVYFFAQLLTKEKEWLQGLPGMTDNMLADIEANINAQGFELESLRVYGNMFCLSDLEEQHPASKDEAFLAISRHIGITLQPELTALVIGIARASDASPALKALQGTLKEEFGDLTGISNALSNNPGIVGNFLESILESRPK